MDQTISLPKWSQPTLFAFRFFFLYFVLYIFPFPLTYIPYSWTIYQPISEFSQNIAGAIAKTFLNIEGSAVVNAGSGDATIRYIQFYFFLSVALLIAGMWSIIDRKKNFPEKLWHGLIIVLRYYLAVAMLGYGLAKVFKTQFPFPSTSYLTQSYGESSPMGLLWTFMGYSTAYNIFTGLWEVIGGALLFFNRTRLVGALLIIGVMSNVVMLNLCYDVPVKLYSIHLLAMAIFLVVPDLKKLRSFLWGNASTSYLLNAIQHKKTIWFYAAGKGLILFVLLTGVIGTIQVQRQDAENLAKRKKHQSLFGEYNVETFISNGEAMSLESDNTRRWKRVLINARNIDVQNMDGGSIPWHFHGNNHTKRIVLLSPDLSTSGNFTFKMDSTLLTMVGVLNNDSLKIVLKKKSDDSFPLVSRGFHWISEEPFFR